MSPNKKPPGEGQLRVIWFGLTALAVAVTVLILVGAVWGVGRCLNLLSPVLWPLAIAAVLSYLLDPAVSWLEYRKVSRTWGIIIVFIVVFCVIGGLLGSVVPQMAKETNNLATRIPTYTAQAQQRLNDWINRAEKAAATPLPPPAPTNSTVATNFTLTSTNATTGSSKTNSTPVDLSKNIHQIHNEIIASASDWTGKLLSKFGAWLLEQVAKVTELIEMIVAVILIPIYTFYFLREKKWIRTHWTNYLPIRDSRAKREIVFIIGSINQYMIAFFRGQVLVALCSGVLYTIGFLCFGLDYAFLLGFFCLLLTMVPFLGPMISGIISIGLTAMQFGDWYHPLMIFFLFVVVVGLENFFYSPRIMGNRVGMHPAVIIVAVMVGITLLGGVLGGVLAIPLAAALRVMMVRYLWKKPKEAERILA